MVHQKMMASHLPSDIVSTLNQYFSDQDTVQIQCFTTDKIFKDIIDSYDSNNFKINKIISKQIGNVIHTSYVIQNNELKKELGKFQSLQVQNELYILGDKDTKFFNKVVLQILDGFYPVVLPVFTHSDKIYHILEQFETVMNVQLRKKDVTQKQIFNKVFKTKKVRKSIQDECLQDYPLFHKVFEEAKNNGLWIEGITVFSGKDHICPDIQFFISRKGPHLIYNGSFDSIFSNILHPIVEHSLKQHKLFEHRGRSEQLDLQPRSIIIKFPRNIFKKIKNRKKFIEILTKYPRCSCSITSEDLGPVYMSILDQTDNSSFSVRTFREDSILLIPQINTSSLSLARFSEYLTSMFYEGIIENFEYKHGK